VLPEVLLGGAVGQFGLKSPINIWRINAKTPLYLVLSSFGFGGANTPLHPFRLRYW